MKPVAIFRHAPLEGPGQVIPFLDSHAIPWRLICIDAGEPVPVVADAFSGLVFMGGPMSVNDDLPWITPVLSLIQDAYAKDIPVLGHCLGGQLMAKALGGRVTRNPVKELGWGAVRVADTAEAYRWFGEYRQFVAFHWHGETFSLPPGAQLLLSSTHCAHQAFSIGKHLAMQCHVEMNSDMIRDWCEVGADEITAAMSSPAVQDAATMLARMQTQLPPLNHVAGLLYTRWIQGLAEC